MFLKLMVIKVKKTLSKIKKLIAVVNIKFD